jgi:catechol 2,3-dioxygenase-like lactoylglutathione lyase family enzyme
MERVYFADHRGTPILHVDYSGLDDPEDLRGVAREASTVVQTHAPGSLLVLVDLRGVPHSLVTAAILQQGVADSRPHVRARAVVGVSSAGSGSFEVAVKLFGGPMARFEDPTAAAEWLMEQAPARDPSTVKPHDTRAVAKILTGAPVLLVRDVVAAADYFRDKLGFAYDRLWGDPPDFCMVERDGNTVMLSQAPAHAELVPNWRVVDQMWDVYFWVDDVDAIYAELQQRGATIDYELGLKPYGVKEFGVQDVDDHDIAFGQLVGHEASREEP